MADATTLVMFKGEDLNSFNARLAEACADGNVSAAKMALLVGIPTVHLFSEVIADDKGKAEIAAGPFDVAVVPLVNISQKDAERTEKNLRKIYEAAAGTVAQIDHETDDFGSWALVVWAYTEGKMAIVENDGEA